MSGSYNSVPPPANLASTGADSSKGQDASFLDAIAKARAIAAKVKEQHANKVDSEDSTNRKRALSEEDDSATVHDSERDPKRLLVGQDYASAAARYGLGSDEQINRSISLAPLYGPGSILSTEVEEFTVPNNLVGLIIGRSGDSLKRIQSLSGAKINFDQDPLPGELERKTFVSGSSEAIKKAREMIDQLIQNHQNGRVTGVNGFNGTSGGSAYLPMGAQETQVTVPGNRVGLIIGRGGETIRELMEHSGARINVVQDNTIPHGTNVERLVNISGTPDCIERAKTLVQAIVSGEINTSRGSLAMQIEGAGIRFGQDKVTIQVPCEKVGLLIGRGGETIKYLQQQSRARIIIEVPETEPPPPQRNIIISGAHESVEYAKTLIYEKLDGLNGGSGDIAYNEYGFPPTAPIMQGYGSYPYYPTSIPGYGYGVSGDNETSKPSGESSNAEGTEESQDGSAAPSEQDMQAYNDYYKQCQDYYAAYYSSLGYTYPPTGAEGGAYTGGEPTASSQPPNSETSHI